MDLVALVYRQVEAFPECEKSGLVAGLKKAVAAVPPKIADASHATELAAYAEAVTKLEGAQASLVELFNTALVARKVGAMGRGPLAKLRRACRRLDALIDKDIARLEGVIDEAEQAKAQAAAARKALQASRVRARVAAREAAMVLAVGRTRASKRGAARATR